MSDYVPSLGAKLGDKVRYFVENPSDSFNPVPRLGFVLRETPPGCEARIVIFEPSGKTSIADALGSVEPRVGYFTPFDA